jgi:uracil-DNA glycosylase
MEEELKKDYIAKLEKEIAESHEELEELAIYPPRHLVFRAFDYGEPNVVIVGQDPYHSPGAACGLSFSVPSEKRRPPSLLRIYKELARDPKIEMIDKDIPKHGDLSSWADQGVMLLNVALTVREGKAGSHMGLADGAWKTFTRAVIKRINDEAELGVVWLLWGNFAQSFAGDIDATKHTIISSGHPSPLNRTNPFIGCGCFSPLSFSQISVLSQIS